jgi:hypothetical protein
MYLLNVGLRMTPQPSQSSKAGPRYSLSTAAGERVGVRGTFGFMVPMHAKNRKEALDEQAARPE